MHWTTFSISLCCASLLLPQLLCSQISPEWKIIREQQQLDKTLDTFRSSPAPGRMIKIGDLTNVIGEESVTLTGFGIVSGLNGTGDSGPGAIKMLLKVALQHGIQLSIDDVKKNNLALVSVSANVGPHQRLFDLAVKSVSDAKSLQNGFLEASSLNPVGSDEVYAVASGAVSLGSRYFSTGGGGGNTGQASVTIGHPTTAFVINGGELIKEIPVARIEDNKLSLFIKHPNDRTAINIAKVINQYMGRLGVDAEPANASTVLISVPEYYRNHQGRITQLIADINDLPSAVSRRAIITIDQGSGVIAMTEGVKMEPGSITIAGITVSVTSDVQPVIRPTPLVVNGASPLAAAQVAGQTAAGQTAVALANAAQAAADRAATAQAAAATAQAAAARAVGTPDAAATEAASQAATALANSTQAAADRAAAAADRAAAAQVLLNQTAMAQAASPVADPNNFVSNPQLEVNQGKANFLSIPAGTDLRKVQEAFNAMKLTPINMISVFNAMHKAGMIHAELIILPS